MYSSNQCKDNAGFVTRRFDETCHCLYLKANTRLGGHASISTEKRGLERKGYHRLDQTEQHPYFLGLSID